MIDAKEIDVDAISDGKKVLIAEFLNILNKLEYILVIQLASYLLKRFQKNTWRDSGYYKRISKELQIIGFINIQFAIKDDKIFVIEVNPRASRTVPFISKAVGIPLANLATKIMLGEKLKF